MCIRDRLNPDSKNDISVYASGINPSQSHEQIAVAKSMGIKAFKVKIGFNHSLDIDLLESLDNYFTNDEMMMLDVNQGWNFQEAAKYLKILEDYGFEAIDNIPLSFIPALLGHSSSNTTTEENLKIAIGIDVRTRDFDEKTLLKSIEQVSSTNLLVNTFSGKSKQSSFNTR